VATERELCALRMSVARDAYAAAPAQAQELLSQLSEVKRAAKVEVSAHAHIAAAVHACDYQHDQRYYH
jgi:hypothetical protein